MDLITTRFDALSTADDVVEGIDLSGRRAVVTGAASGIGVETARSLARAGAQVTLAVRDTTAGDRTAADITASTGNADVRVAQLDLLDRASVAASPTPGTARSTCWSTTPGSWPTRSRAAARAGSRSSPPTTSGTWRWA